jgi:hypothetical protein
MPPGTPRARRGLFVKICMLRLTGRMSLKALAATAIREKFCSDLLIINLGSLETITAILELLQLLQTLTAFVQIAMGRSALDVAAACLVMYASLATPGPSIRRRWSRRLAQWMVGQERSPQRPVRAQMRGLGFMRVSPMRC